MEAGFVAVAALMAIMPVPLLAWGDEGHKITAQIAYQLLTPRAHNNVLAVLEGETVDAVAVWPDALKRAGDECPVPVAKNCNPNYRPETAQWHFVDMPLSESQFDPGAEYCRPTRYGDCIVPAIEGFRDILNRSTKRAFAGNTAEQKRKLNDALSFIVHFLGDIHQPLHCADNEGDGGGNNVLVTWQGEPPYKYEDHIWNLHAVWDEYLVDRNILTMAPGKQTYDSYATSLLEKLSPAERNYAQLKSQSIENGQPENVIAWAEGSHALARTAAYVLPSKTVKKSSIGLKKTDPQGNPKDIIVLDEKYFTDNMAAVERQLRLGGVRLARILNEIYDKDIPAH
ncbi:MAG TPA: S1/P1 nuclease [Thermoanaerobaculia bacterium]|nr:S1/P1 nuclease [Thermoanaerobaculia bacterium]